MFGWKWLWIQISLHQYYWFLLVFHPAFSVSSANSLHYILSKCPGNVGADSETLWNAATQCLTNSITKASVTTHPFCPWETSASTVACPPLFSSCLLILSNYMWHSLSIMQWKGSSCWQEKGEDCLGNKSCHKQHFLLRQRILARSPLWIDLQGLKSHFMPTYTLWLTEKQKISLFSHSCH